MTEISWTVRYRWGYFCVFLEQWAGTENERSTTGEYIEIKIHMWWYYRARDKLRTMLRLPPRPPKGKPSLPTARLIE